jgi:hypothetical protein
MRFFFPLWTICVFTVLSCSKSGTKESNGVAGNWVESSGTTKISLSGSSAKICSGTTEYYGTFNASAPSMSFTINGVSYSYQLKLQSSSELLVGLPNEPFDASTAVSFSSTSSYSCSTTGGGTGGGGTGGGSGGGSGGGTTTGKVVFWSSYMDCGNITVSINGELRTITSTYNSTPSCGAAGTATYTLAPGTYNYSYSAPCKTNVYYGTVTVTSGGCASAGLSVAAPPPGKITFFTRLTGLPITVNYAGQTKTINNATAYPTLPPCGTASGSANFSVVAGTYNYTASGGGKSWSGTISVSSNQCKLEMLQ